MCKIYVYVYYCRHPGCGAGHLQGVKKKPCPKSTSPDELADQICPEGEEFKVKTPNRRWKCPKHGGTLPSVGGPPLADADFGTHFDAEIAKILGEGSNRVGHDLGRSISPQWEFDSPSSDDGNSRTKILVPYRDRPIDEVCEPRQDVSVAAGQTDNGNTRVYQETTYSHTRRQERRLRLHHSPSQLRLSRYHPYRSAPERHQSYQMASEHVYQHSVYREEWTQWETTQLGEQRLDPSDVFAPGHSSHVATRGDDATQMTAYERFTISPPSLTQRNRSRF